MAFHFALGHVGGVEAVGVASSVLAIAWVVGSFGSLGLPDRAMYGVARDDADPSLGRAHGLFLLLAGAGAAMVGLVVLALDVEVTLLPYALVLGTFLQHAAAFTFASLRGAARPGLEAVALSVSALILAGAAALSLTHPELGLGLSSLGFVASGGCALAVATVGVRRRPSLWPRLPTAAGARAELRVSVPYLVVGAGGMALGTADLIGAQLWLDSAQVGALQCGTLVTRTGLAAPWFLSVLALKALGDATPPNPRELVAVSVVACAGACLVAFATVPWVGLGYGVEPDLFRPVTWAAIALSLPSYLAIGLLPRAMMLHPRTTVRLFLALGVLAPGLFWAGARLGIPGLQLAHSLAHLVLAVGFLVRLWPHRGSAELDPRQGRTQLALQDERETSGAGRHTEPSSGSRPA